MGQRFKNRPSEICGRQPLKNSNFKGCLPQISLGPFMKTLSHMELFIKEIKAANFEKIGLWHETPHFAQ